MLETLRSIGRDGDALVFNRGLERETLRTDSSGNLSRRPHPAALGSKLTHSLITTDFCESQLELITPVKRSAADALDLLEDVHRFVNAGLEDELIWPTSMPCELPVDNEIPLARYGSSNIAKLKETYRSGLGYRYGRTMQTICAVHYNFSFQDSFWQHLAKLEGASEALPAFRSRRYFDMMRNFRRLSWLPTYLFGASPAVCDSFVNAREHNLQRLNDTTLYMAEATSLRNGGLGYQSDTQSGLIDICYNSLDNYVHSLAEAVCTEFNEYRELSETHRNIIQVNSNVLQSEAEFYTTVRAKRVPAEGQSLLEALTLDGVQYVEVRLLDVDPYSPVGIDEKTIHFMDILLLYCLLTTSPEHDDALCRAVEDNMRAVVTHGRGNVSLNNDGKQVPLTTWATTVIADLMELAQELDNLMGNSHYQDAIAAQKLKVLDSQLTPSARMLNMIGEGSFLSFALGRAAEHRDYFNSQPMDREQFAHFQMLASQSAASWQQLESEPQIPFTEYLAQLQANYEALLSHASV
jgi:glutamate--cysteine ligase